MSDAKTEIEKLHAQIRLTVSQALQRADGLNDNAGLDARIRTLEVAARLLATPAGAQATTLPDPE